MPVIGVAEAAGELGVSPRRVRQMLAAGNLQGERVGRAWVIEREAIERFSARRPEVGRQWRPEAAWAFLALMQGREVDLSAVDRVRIGRRVDRGVEANLGRLRARARERRFYAHPSVLLRILEQPGIVRSGISAVGDYAIDLVVQEAAEAYVQESNVESLISEFALDESSDRPNLVLRVVVDEAWPFDAGQRVASALVVAIDLLEADDERVMRAGSALLETCE